MFLRPRVRNAHRREEFYLHGGIALPRFAVTNRPYSQVSWGRVRVSLVCVGVSSEFARAFVVAEAFASAVVAALYEANSINAVTEPFYAEEHMDAEGLVYAGELVVVEVLSSALREQLDSRGSVAIPD